MGTVYIAMIKDSTAKISLKKIHQDKVTGVTELSENKFEPILSIPVGKTALLAAAIDNLQRSLAIGIAINALEITQECYDRLSEAYKLKGDYKKAMEYADNARTLKDSVSHNRTGIK